MEHLGKMLFELRKSMGESQMNMADGIISIPELCKVEHGELQTDYFTLQALFERLGKSVDKLEIAISNDDYELMALRDEIELHIEETDITGLDALMKKYNTFHEMHRPIHRQYLLIMQALMQYIEIRDHEKCLHRLENALSLTLPDYRKQNTVHGQRLCNQEIRIILLMAYCKKMLHETDTLICRLEQLERSLLHYYTDEEEQAKIYPQCAWLLGSLYLEQDKAEDAYMICRKGEKILTENGSLLGLRELLELEEHCLQKMERTRELRQCRNYQNALTFLYEAAGKKQNANVMHLFIKSPFQGEVIITNELIKELREAKKMSQPELCEGICTPETLSRIECGKRSPNRKNLFKMLKKLGMDRKTYYGFVVADDYAVYEKVRLFNRCSPKGQYEEEEKFLHEIEGKLDLAIPVNRQFVELGHIVSKIRKKELSRSEAIEPLKRLLYLTMPPVSAQLVYRMPFRMEYHIINVIALNLKHNGYLEQAINIYEQVLQCYKKSRVQMKYHGVPGLTLYLNYAGILELNNQLEEAMQTAKEGLLNGINCCRADVSGDILANLSLVYGKQGMTEMEEKYLRYGYYLIDLYKKESSRNIIKNAYEKKFGRKL